MSAYMRLRSVICTTTSTIEREHIGGHALMYCERRTLAISSQSHVAPIYGCVQSVLVRFTRHQQAAALVVDEMGRVTAAMYNTREPQSDVYCRGRGMRTHRT